MNPGIDRERLRREGHVRWNFENQLLDHSSQFPAISGQRLNLLEISAPCTRSIVDEAN